MKQRLVVVIAVVLAALGGGVVTLLSARADESRQAQLALAHLWTAFGDVQTAALTSLAATPSASTSRLPAVVQGLADASGGARARVQEAIQGLRRYPRVNGVSSLQRGIQLNLAAGKDLLALLRAHPGVLARARSGDLSPSLVRLWVAVSSTGGVASSVSKADRAYSSRARIARDEEIACAGLVIALLLAAFGFYFRRSRKLHQDVERLLADSRQEATTDALTGLRNRRALDGSFRASEARSPAFTGDRVSSDWDL